VKRLWTLSRAFISFMRYGFYETEEYSKIDQKFTFNILRRNGKRKRHFHDSLAYMGGRLINQQCISASIYVCC